MSSNWMVKVYLEGEIIDRWRILDWPKEEAQRQAESDIKRLYPKSDKYTIELEAPNV